MVVFWEHGYDGASLAHLTAAMGISRKSMYAAFGNKDALFLHAVERYAAGPGDYGVRAVEAPTALDVARTFLVGAAEAATQPGYPTGCLGVRAALAVGDTGRFARDALAGWRADTQRELRERFGRAQSEGDLPHDVDLDLATRYVLTVANGLTLQAIGGASREQLLHVVDAALATWPVRAAERPGPFGDGQAPS